MNNFEKLTNKKIQFFQYKFKYIFLLFGLFLISLPATSNDSALQKCIDTDDSSERLSCFDEFFKENKTMQQALAIPKKQEVTKTAEKNIKDYGLPKPKEDFSIKAKIVKVNKRGNYKIYIILDNNQTWRSVKDIYDRIPVNNGQTVSISEGFLGGHVMKVEGKKVSLRVRRVK